MSKTTRPSSAGRSEAGATEALSNLLDLCRQVDDQKTGPKSDRYRNDAEVVRDYVNELEKRLEALLAPLEFEYFPGRPLMIVKLGSMHNGWIPNAQHFDKVRRVLKASGEDRTKNILLYHYGIQIDTLPAEAPNHLQSSSRP